jgi:calcineurin-like phosphoesterase family protein
MPPREAGADVVFATYSAIPHKDVMTTFFTADHHFGHQAIIGMCSRPFADVEQMDRALIDNWNAVVQPSDTVWHLGDFAYRCDQKRKRAILSQLNGNKHLIAGNHDDADTRSMAWGSVSQMKEINIEGTKIFLCHYGMRTWPGAQRGALHLYGHSHGTLPGNAQCCDVGVDCWAFRPVALPAIREVLERAPAVPQP